MRPQDLRIGNLLQDRISETFLKVVQLTEKDIITYVIDRSKYPLEKGWSLEPIPLTKQLMFNLGFVILPSESDKYILFYKSCEQENKTFLVECYSDEFYTYSSFRLRYVHQIQNIYYLLIGKELTLKAS